MDWVRPFYARQHGWMERIGIDDGGADRERVDAIRSVVPPPARVLELGAGSGRTALATARAGYAVVAVELVAAAVADVAALPAAAAAPGSLSIRVADMFAVGLDGRFAVVAYWDGFGIGDDADQVRLLRRVREWLEPGGHALIDVFLPAYWRAAAGREMVFGAVRRRYGFDPAGNRMLDTWWEAGAEDSAVTQSLRCYDPDAFAPLAAGAGLRLLDAVPGGAWDHDRQVWESVVPLGRAMTFRAVLARR